MAPQRPAIPFSQWTLNTARQAIDVPNWVPMNRAFYHGDHWQNAQGWIGPRPDFRDVGAMEAMEEIARGFTSQNVIGEIVDRRVAGVVGREPSWSLTAINLNQQGEPSREDAALIAEAYDFLTPWWDERGIHELLEQWCAAMLWARRATLRLFPPPGMLVPAQLADGTAVQVLRATSAADALRQLYVETPRPEDAQVFTNHRTKDRAGIYLYDENDQPRAELSYIEANTGITQVRQLGAGLSPMPTRLPLGGRLTMFEAQFPEFISQQIRQMQRALNLSLTMLPRNIVTGGFLEMVVLNGMMPGHWETKQDGTRGNFIPAPMYRGAGVTNWIQGIETGETREGTKAVTTPSVNFRPPSPVTPVIESNGELYTQILSAANQIHVLLNGEAVPSGRSRDSARGEYRNSLRKPRARVQRGGRWLIESALAWVELLTNQPGRYTSRLRCNFQCLLDTGVPSVEERERNTSEAEAGLLSDDTAMERNGVEDVDAENVRIVTSRRGRLALSKARVEVVTMWMDAGLTFEGACTVAGMDTTEIAELRPFMVEPKDDEDEDDELPPRTGDE